MRIANNPENKSMPATDPPAPRKRPLRLATNLRDSYGRKKPQTVHTSKPTPKVSEHRVRLALTRRLQCRFGFLEDYEDFLPHKPDQVPIQDYYTWLIQWVVKAYKVDFVTLNMSNTEHHAYMETRKRDFAHRFRHTACTRDTTDTTTCLLYTSPSPRD